LIKKINKQEEEDKQEGKDEVKQGNFVKIKKVVNGLQNINAVLTVKDPKDSLKNNIANIVAKNKIKIAQ
jgi:hypothetical protein